MPIKQHDLGIHSVLKKNDYQKTYNKMPWKCEVCKKTYCTGSKSRHLKSLYHLVRKVDIEATNNQTNK